MVTQPIRQPSAVTWAPRPPAGRRPHHATLLGDLHGLARALAVPPGAPRWREQVLTRLVPVREDFADHVRVTEGPGGLYAELLAQAPRLDRGVRLLTREHAAIAGVLTALQHAAEVPGVSADELRGLAEHLLRTFSRHRQRGADLLWQAYQTDLGGET
ncbi:hemerythrin domain-containing protein [Micromonospora costi]|uniref:Hemerythrin domain-containing protein n=1 Tax=Micromonospora costi TaxID=1530042 RepID=A0A3B0AFL5_9ACTN|nr:hemerythrin domain-containing protein [Micromonospora costi]RKN58246.1 hypothetical protein D7193_06600 [Micromonospora costi]